MRLLKYLLLIVLCVSITWAAAIFLGPWALSKVIENKLSGSVILSGVKVSPSLNITARRVVAAGSGAGTASLQDLKVQVVKFSPLTVEAEADAVELGEVAAASNLRVSAGFEGSGGWQISGQFEDFLSQDLLTSGLVTFSSVLDTNENLLSDVVMEIDNVASIDGPDLSVDNVILQLQSVRLNKAVNDQEISGTLKVPEISSGALGGQARNILADFIIKRKMLSSTFAASEIEFSREQLSASSLDGDFEVRDFDALDRGALNLNFGKVEFGEYQALQPKFAVTFDAGEMELSGVGAINESEVIVGGRYFGLLPASDFDISARSYGVASGLELDSDFKLALHNHPLKINLSARGALTNVNNLATCLRADCLIEDLAAEYLIDLEPEQIRGASRCETILCRPDESAHEITTTNTNEIISQLQKIKALNPLILGAFYSQMLGGEQFGAGHKIQF